MRHWRTCLNTVPAISKTPRPPLPIASPSRPKSLPPAAHHQHRHRPHHHPRRGAAPKFTETDDLDLVLIPLSLLAPLPQPFLPLFAPNCRRPQS